MNATGSQHFFQFQMRYFLAALLLFSSCASKKAPKTDTTSPKTEEIRPHPSKKTSTTLKFTSGIRAILHDSKGRYWLGSHQEGVALYDGKTFTYFTVEDGLSNMQVRRIQEDDRGNIWFGTGDGVSSFDGQQMISHSAQNLFLGFGQKGDNWSLAANDLWFNARNKAGVYRFDGKGLTYLDFPIKKDSKTEGSYAATNFSRTKDKLWIATYTAAIGYDGQSFTVIDNESLGFTETSGYLHIRSILVDSKGRLWIGNNGIGVLLNEGGKTINFSALQQLIHPNSTKNGSRSAAGTLEHVFAIAEDRQGNIWFGDRDTGAWKYDGKSMHNYTIDAALPSPHVWDIYTDRNNDLLFATHDGGVYRFSGEVFERKF